MVGQSLVDAFGKDLEKSVATRPGFNGKGQDYLHQLLEQLI